MCRIPDVISGLSTFGTTSTPPQRIPVWMVKFMSIAYGCQSSNIPDLTKLRLTLFEKLSKSKTYADIDRCLPASAKALLPHIQRAAYQTIIHFQKKLLCTTSDTSGSNEIRMEERRIELRAVGVFRKPIKLT